jgi:hypothetical protein
VIDTSTPTPVVTTSQIVRAPAGSNFASLFVDQQDVLQIGSYAIKLVDTSDPESTPLVIDTPLDGHNFVSSPHDPLTLRTLGGTAVLSLITLPPAWTTNQYPPTSYADTKSRNEDYLFAIDENGATLIRHVRTDLDQDAGFTRWLKSGDALWRVNHFGARGFSASDPNIDLGAVEFTATGHHPFTGGEGIVISA